MVSCRLQLHGQLELGADAVGAGDQHRFAVAIQRQLEQRAEAAEPGQHARAEGVLDDRLDALDQGIAGVDIDPGLRIAEGTCIGGGGLIAQGWLQAGTAKRAF